MAEPKQPSDMTLMETVEALVRAEREHDLDCEEGAGSDRCPRCLAEAAGDKVKELHEHACGLDEFLLKVTQWEGSAEDELGEAIEDAEKLAAATDSTGTGA